MYRKYLSLFVVVLVLSIPGFVSCQEWITANQVTVVWDPVTKFDNGQPIPADDPLIVSEGRVFGLCYYLAPAPISNLRPSILK